MGAALESGALLGKIGGTVPAMDAEARRKQLSAAIRRTAGGDRAALRLIYDETAKLFGVIASGKLAAL